MRETRTRGDRPGSGGRPRARGFAALCCLAGCRVPAAPNPIAKTTAEVDLSLTRTDRESGDVVWEKQLSSEVHRYYTLYTS